MNLQETWIPLEQAIEHTLGDDRLDEARRQIENGMYRAAAADLGVLLEHSLRRLFDLNAKLAGGRFRHRPFTLSESIRILVDEGEVELEDAKDLERVIEIRNLAVRKLDEPSFHDVQHMYDAVRKFVDKYLGGQPPITN